MVTFIVGEKATVMKRQFRGPAEPTSVKTVTRVTKLFVELEDGSQWSIDDGLSYPKNRRPRFGGGTASYIEPGGTEEIERRAQARKARAEIEGYCRSFTSAVESPRHLSDDAALKILEIWNADIAKRKELTS